VQHRAILDAAEVLLERGGQASITAVAAEAGVSRMTVYAHFPTRQDLLGAVVERAAMRPIRRLVDRGRREGASEPTSPLTGS
jgi:AcrR family transcriptional regulator